MNWRHRIAVVVLFVLAALPVSGMICAMTCVSASIAAAAHHGDGQDCDQAMPPSASAAASASASASVSVSVSVSVSGSESADAPAAAVTRTRVAALSDYDCGHHDSAVPQVAATAPPRADDAVIAVQAASDPVDLLFGGLTAVDAVAQYTPPPDSTPPTTTPLVLRV